jgi:hypothetical protein
MESKTIDDHKRFWKKYITNKIMDYEEKVWKNDIQKKSKLCNYINFKNKIKFEKYLNGNDHVAGRWYHTALRTGSNTLEIEQGRWKGVKREHRLCKHCNSNQVENEQHFPPPGTVARSTTSGTSIVQ